MSCGPYFADIFIVNTRSPMIRLVDEIIAPYLFLKKKKKNMAGIPTIIPAAVVIRASEMLSASLEALPAPSAAIVLNA